MTATRIDSMWATRFMQNHVYYAPVTLLLTAISLGYFSSGNKVPVPREDELSAKSSSCGRASSFGDIEHRMLERLQTNIYLRGLLRKVEFPSQISNSNAQGKSG